MDDGSGAAKRSLVALAGVLVLLGAGCAAAAPPPVTPQTIPSAPSHTTPTSSTQPVGLFDPDQKVTALCYVAGSPLPADFHENEMMNLMKQYRPSSDTSTFDAPAEALDAKLKEQYQAGWNVDRFCVTSVNGVRVAYFSLYGFTGSALKETPTQSVPGTGTAKTPTRLGLQMADDAMYLSDTFAVSHSDAVPLKLLDVIALDDSGLSTDVHATLTQGVDRYDIDFMPDETVTQHLYIKKQSK